MVFDPKVVLALAAVCLLLSAAAAGDGVLPGDVAVARCVQEVGVPGLDRIVRAANWAGAGSRLTLLATGSALVLASRRRVAAAALVLAAVATRAANPVLKDLVDSPRPTADLVRVTEHAGGLGFPSGHVMGSVLFYGVVFVLVGELAPRAGFRRVVRGLALLIVVAIGFGRVYVGAHWPSDVVGGYLWGGLGLILILGGRHALLVRPDYTRSSAMAEAAPSAATTRPRTTSSPSCRGRSASRHGARPRTIGSRARCASWRPKPGGCGPGERQSSPASPTFWSSGPSERGSSWTPPRKRDGSAHSGIGRSGARSR
jgi:membrane-associated phospholipid phosphatase